MNIIIPMAGRGTRLRPHTLTIPKPLIPIAGKPIVQHLVEYIVEMCAEPVQNIGFVVGQFGEEVEKQLLKIASESGAKGHIFYQDQPLGTAHAILCAEELLKQHVTIAFADTLFRAEKQQKIDASQDGVIWTQEVDNPSAFGVVKLDNNGVITEFIEKPKEPVSNLAIIGIYYFKDGTYLKNELQYLIDNDIREKGEYQLTSALENMKKKGLKFRPATIKEWLDCGNKDAVVHTNSRILEMSRERDDELVVDSALIENSTIIEPCYIGANTVIKNSVIGPYATIGSQAIVEQCIISNSIVQNHTKIKNKIIHQSMIGNYINLQGSAEEYSLGDYSEIWT